MFVVVQGTDIEQPGGSIHRLIFWIGLKKHPLN